MKKPNAQDLRRAASIFKALSHPGRLRIVCRMSGAPPMTQTQLVSELGMPQSTVARHIGQLRLLGLLKATRRGGEVLLELASPVTNQLLEAMCEWVHPETGEQLSKDFERFVRREAS